MLSLLYWVGHYIKWTVSSLWPAGEPNYLSLTQSVDSGDRGDSHAIICNECVAKERIGVVGKGEKEVEIRQQTVAASNWNKRADNATQLAAVAVADVDAAQISHLHWKNENVKWQRHGKQRMANG